MTIDEQISFLTRGCVDIVSKTDLAKKLESGKTLKIGRCFCSVQTKNALYLTPFKKGTEPVPALCLRMAQRTFAQLRTFTPLDAAFETQFLPK